MTVRNTLAVLAVPIALAGCGATSLTKSQAPSKPISAVSRPIRTPRLSGPAKVAVAAPRKPVAPSCGSGTYVSSDNEGSGGCAYTYNFGTLVSPPGTYLVGLGGSHLPVYEPGAQCDIAVWSNNTTSRVCA